MRRIKQPKIRQLAEYDSRLPGMPLLHRRVAAAVCDVWNDTLEILRSESEAQGSLAYMGKTIMRCPYCGEIHGADKILMEFTRRVTIELLDRKTRFLEMEKFKTTERSDQNVVLEIHPVDGRGDRSTPATSADSRSSAE